MNTNAHPGRYRGQSSQRYVRPAAPARGSIVVPRGHTAFSEKSVPLAVEVEAAVTPVAAVASVAPVVPSLPVPRKVQVSTPRADGTYFDMKPVIRRHKNPAHTVHKQTAKATVVVRPELLVPVVDQMLAEGSKQVSESSRNEVERLVAQVQPIRKKRRFRSTHLLYGMASMIFIVGMYVTIDGWFVNRSATEQTKVLAAQSSDGESSNDRDSLNEDQPTGTDKYQVAADLPRILSIPAINVSTRVLQLGVKSNGELGTPSNIYDAGWYTGSSKPTDKAGAILIDGHVSGPTKQGVFYDLKKLKVGDDIVLERGDGVKLTFTVQKVETVKVEDVDMSTLLRSVDQTKLGLNLITCGGSFDAASNEFQSRVLVYAAQK